MPRPGRTARPDRPRQRAARPRLYAGQPAAAHRAHPRGPAADRADRQRPPALRPGRRGRMERGRPEPGDRVVGEHGPGLCPQEGVKRRRRARAAAAVRCRAARVHQVVVNLLMNAIDACLRRRHGHAPHAAGARRRRRPDRGRRHRLRHRPGDPRADLRPVLHHQADRRGDRAGPLDQLRDRPGAPRDDRRPVDPGDRVVLHGPDSPAGAASRAAPAGTGGPEAG